MANYYYVKIESDKMTQDVANEILQTIAPKQLIRSFHYREGMLSFNTRGLEDITPILIAYDFNEEEDKIEVKDEFEYAYENMMTPEEAVKKDLTKVIDKIQRDESQGIVLSDELNNIKEILVNIIKENTKYLGC